MLEKFVIQLITGHYPEAIFVSFFLMLIQAKSNKI